MGHLHGEPGRRDQVRRRRLRHHRHRSHHHLREHGGHGAPPPSASSRTTPPAPRTPGRRTAALPGTAWAGADRGPDGLRRRGVRRSPSACSSRGRAPTYVAGHVLFGLSAICASLIALVASIVRQVRNVFSDTERYRWTLAGRHHGNGQLRCSGLYVLLGSGLALSDRSRLHPDRARWSDFSILSSCCVALVAPAPSRSPPPPSRRSARDRDSVLRPRAASPASSRVVRPPSISPRTMGFGGRPGAEWRAREVEYLPGLRSHPPKRR